MMNQDNTNNQPVGTEEKTMKAYFHFHDENEEVDYRIALTMTDSDVWEEWFDADIQKGDSIICGLEEKYGVHDTHDFYSEDENTLIFGFSSYEVETEEKLLELMNEWKQALIKLGWTTEDMPIFKVLDSDPNDSFY